MASTPAKAGAPAYGGEPSFMPSSASKGWSTVTHQDTRYFDIGFRLAHTKAAHEEECASSCPGSRPGVHLETFERPSKQ